MSLNCIRQQVQVLKGPVLYQVDSPEMLSVLTKVVCTVTGFI